MDRVRAFVRLLPLWLAVCFLAVGLAGLIWAVGLPPRYAIDLDPAGLRPQDGNAYAVDVSGPHGLVGVFFELRYDQPTAPADSRLAVLEDGKRLPLPHASPQDIASLGAGRFQHAKTSIILSASNNSDPRANGKHYRAEAPLSPRIRLLGVLVLLILTGGVRSALSAALPGWRWLQGVGWPGAGACAAAGSGILAYAILAPASDSWSLPTGACLVLFSIVWSVAAARLNQEQTAAYLFSRSSIRLPAWSGPAGILLGAIGAILLYQILLARAATPSLGLAGYFQISDASGYWDCANLISNAGAGDSWCHRRPLYSLFLSGVSLAAGRNLEIVLFLQAGIVGAAAYVFAREITRWIGAIAAVITAAGCLLYAWTFVLGQTMTEVLALALALVSGAFLLRAGETRALAPAVAGAFLFTLGELVRPGALFALPLLALWVAQLGDRKLKSMAIGLAASGLAMGLAYLINVGAVIAIGGDPGLTNANFPQTLYGLSTGRDWSSLIADRPDLVVESKAAVAEVYRLAFENIRAHPGVFLAGLWENLVSYLANPWYGALLPFNFLRMIAVAGGLAAAVVASRSSQRGKLLLALVVGELVSSTLLTRDANVRVWATSAPLAQLATFALLVVMLARWGLRPGEILPPRPAGGSRTWSRAAIALSIGLFALTLAPLTPLRLAERPALLPAPDCPVGLRGVTIDAASSDWITITDEASHPSSFPRKLNTRDLGAGLSPGVWFGPALARLNNIQLIRTQAVRQGTSQPEALYAAANLAIPRSGTVGLCVDTSSTVDIADVKFSRIISVPAANR
ncbi:MAG TPA: hypothetical protein VG942_18120 [Hyphomonadaceae bacterium]|nr:hypothetical protein [Hyphomonadaceae bacterium]